MPIRRQSKRYLKLAVSLLVYALDCVWTLLRRLCGRKRNSSFVVLYYHSIMPEQRASFARQMDALLRRATPVSAGTNPDRSTGRRYAAVTFDDAFESLIDHALPALQCRNIPCTIFAVSETFGQAANWEDIDETHGNERIMSLTQARNVASPLVSFGAHTLTHPVLTGLDDSMANREIAGSRSRLRELVWQEIPLFSFPYGAFNHHLVGLCRDAGYERVFTTIPAPIQSDAFVVGRTPAAPTDSRLEFHLKLSGAYRWVGMASWLKAQARKLVRGPRISRQQVTATRMINEKRPT